MGLMGDLETMLAMLGLGFCLGAIAMLVWFGISKYVARRETRSIRQEGDKQ